MLQDESHAGTLCAAMATIVCLAMPAFAGQDAKTAAAVAAAIEGEHRSEEDRARDQYRRPAETLEFLGLRSDMTVVEIWPGQGWYTKILAPVLKDEGTLYAAQFGVNPSFGYQRRLFGDFLKTLGENPKLYRNVVVTHLDFPYQLDIAPAGSADMVLTFRNVHNLYQELYGSGRYTNLAFEAMYDALRTGGVLGIVDHDWPDPDTEDPIAANGYVSAARTIAAAEAAGFELVERSELLRNPKDTKDHPRGVWTLPPVFAMGDEDREKYLAIGESDRFLLKFVKPAE